jgi:hypothetical protein
MAHSGQSSITWADRAANLVAKQFQLLNVVGSLRARLGNTLKASKPFSRKHEKIHSATSSKWLWACDGCEVAITMQQGHEEVTKKVSQD